MNTTALKYVTPTLCNCYQLETSISSSSWDLPLELVHTGTLKAQVLKTSSEVVEVSSINSLPALKASSEVSFIKSPSPVPSHTREEGYVLLPSATLFGNEDSTTNDNLSLSEDEGPTKPSQPFTSKFFRSRLHKMDKNASVLKRKLKFEPAPQKAWPVPTKKQSDPKKAQLTPLKFQQAPPKAKPGLEEAFNESVATEDIGYPPPSEPPNKRSLLSSFCLGLLPSEEPDSVKDLGTERAQLPVIEKHLQTLKTSVSIVPACFSYYMTASSVTV